MAIWLSWLAMNLTISPPPTPGPRCSANLLARAGEEAEIGFKIHPHMLRHACGYASANKGLDTRTLQACLGHRSINSTTRYAALAPGRFKKARRNCLEHE